MIALHVENVSVRLGDRAILRDVSATFGGGEIVSLVGQNGCGKTTLLKAIADMCEREGRVRVVKGESPLPVNAIRYMPQLSAVNSRLTVFEMVLLGLGRELGWRVDRETLDRADRMLHLLEIDHLAHTPVSALSGGQKQLVFLAQTFVSDPKVLLLDEPTSALDLRYQMVVMQAIRRYTEMTGAVTIVVMHDLTNAARFSDKVLLLNDGKVVAFDRPERVLTRDRLESVYEVELSVETSSHGFVNVIPLEPKPTHRHGHGEHHHHHPHGAHHHSH